MIIDTIIASQVGETGCIAGGEDGSSTGGGVGSLTGGGVGSRTGDGCLTGGGVGSLTGGGLGSRGAGGGADCRSGLRRRGAATGATGLVNTGAGCALAGGCKGAGSSALAAKNRTTI